MIKRVLISVLALVIAVIMSSCGEFSAQLQSSNATAANNEEKLIWSLAKFDTPPSEEAQIELNRLLKERGYTVQVEFIADEKTSPTKLKESGAQVDIMFFQEGAEGLFQDLTPYFQTDWGKKVEQAFDPKLWKLISDGNKRYYVPKGTLIGEAKAYSANKVIMEKYNLTASDLTKPLAELAPLFERIKQGEGEAFIPFWFDVGVHWNNPIHGQYADILDGILALKKDGVGNKIENVYENGTCVRHLKAVKEFRDKGYFGPTSETLMEESLEQGNYFLFNTASTSPEIDALTSSFSARADRDNSVAVSVTQIPYSEAYLIDEGRNMCNGVTTWSQNPDVAFEILALTVTDPQISNLLIHGIENVNYTIEDGMAVPKDNYTNWVGAGMTFQPLGNDLIAYPLKEKQLKNKQLVHTTFNKNVKSYQAAGFHPDFTNIREECDKLLAAEGGLMFKAKSIWSGYSDDVEADLRRINNDLKEAGIDKVLQELNKQLDLFYQNK